MAKASNGYIGKDKGKWFARITFTDLKGKRKNIKRVAASQAEARATLRTLVRKLEGEGEKAFGNEKITFSYLADYYERHFCQPAVYRNGRKVSGLRDPNRSKGVLVQCRRFFGNQKLRSIKYDDLVAYKQLRLNGITHLKKQRSLSSLNRELGILRRIFNVALAQGWILRNPFNCGEALIQPSADGVRSKVLTVEEERRLLAACSEPCRSHIRPIVIALLDTGARRGEMLKLTWECVDFESRKILLKSETTKTLKARHVGMTQRLTEELSRLWEQSEKDLSASVFGIKTFRKSFNTAARIAGIKTGGLDGLVTHSLRHSLATRLIKGQMPIQLVGKILGHENVNTTFRYLSANDETLSQAASILESLQD
jgi:integrase